MEKLQMPYSQLSHELQVLFQICDAEAKGELSISAISSFLAKLATANGTLFAGDDSYKVMQSLDKSCSGKVTWTSFKKEMEQWVYFTNTYTLISDKLEYGIHLSPQERLALHKILSSYFLRFRREVDQLICANQYEMTYLEDSLGKITPDGVVPSFTLSEKEGKFRDVALALNESKDIVREIFAGTTSVIADGIQRFRQICEIFGYFPLLVERVAILEIITKIFELATTNGLGQRLCTLISVIENTSALSSIKISILQILASLSNCVEIYRCNEAATGAAVQECVEFVNSPLVVEVVVRELSNPIMEIRMQAIYTLGIFASNRVAMLEGYLLSRGVLQNLLNQVLGNVPTQISTLANWCLCIVFKNYLRPDLFSKAGLSVESIAFAIAQAVMYQDNAHALTISVLAQSYLLPLCSGSTEIKGVLGRVINLLVLPDPELQKSCLITLRRTTLQNDALCLEALNTMLAPALISVVDSPTTPSDNKFECLGLINSLILKGYYAKLLEEKLLSVLARLLNESEIYQWDVVCIFKSITNTTEYYVSQLVTIKGVELITQSAQYFVYYDDALRKAYGHSGTVYNVRYLNDCLVTLRNILNKGFTAAQQKVPYNHYFTAFDFPCFEKLRNISETLLNEFREFPSKFVWSIAAEENMVNNLYGLLVDLRDAYGVLGNEIAKTATSYLNAIIWTLEKLPGFVDYSFFTVPRPNEIEIKCFSAEGYPSGDNRILVVPSDVTLAELLTQITGRYQVESVVLQYWDEGNEKLTIDTDLALEKAKLAALKKSYEEKLPRCQLKLLVTTIIVEAVLYQCPECGQAFKVAGADTLLVECPKCRAVLERTLPAVLY